MTDASANSMPLVTALTGLFNRRAAPDGLSEPVLSAAPCGSIDGHLAAPGHRASGDTNKPMPSPPFPPVDSDALAEGTRVEWKPGETATRPEATNVRVI